MFDFLIAPFTEFAFMRRALAGCLALALGASLVARLGVSAGALALLWVCILWALR